MNRAKRRLGRRELIGLGFLGGLIAGGLVVAALRRAFEVRMVPPPDDLIPFPLATHLAAMGVPAMWRSVTGRDVTVAVLDTGVDPEHPYLASSLLGVLASDANHGHVDVNGHGTRSAGLVAGRMANQCVGLAPDTNLVSIKVAGDNGMKIANSYVKALRLAKEYEADVVSISVGDPSLTAEEVAAFEQLAKQSSTIVVAAVGNRHEASAEYPARLPGVIGVSALNRAGSALYRLPSDLRGFDVAAAGQGLFSLEPGGRFGFHDGTSAATALVAGSVALALSAGPRTTRPARALAIRKALTRHDNHSPPVTLDLPMLLEHNGR